VAAHRGAWPEPLELTATSCGAACRPQSADQAAAARSAIVAGLGNIYVCEALFRAGFTRGGRGIDLASAARLVPAIQQVLEEAIAAGGLDLRDFASPDGELGYFSKSFAVYDREGKPAHCGGLVMRIDQGAVRPFYTARAASAEA
jgi:formamidopyrimidine-DNA glycosylase